MSTDDVIRLSVLCPQAADRRSIDRFPVEFEGAHFAMQRADAVGHWATKLESVARVTFVARYHARIVMVNGDEIDVWCNDRSVANRRGHSMVIRTSSNNEYRLGMNLVSEDWGAMSMFWMALLRYWAWEESPTLRGLADKLASRIAEGLYRLATGAGSPLSAPTIGRIRSLGVPIPVRVGLNVAVNSAAIVIPLGSISEQDVGPIGGFLIETVVGAGLVMGATTFDV